VNPATPGPQRQTDPAGSPRPFPRERLFARLDAALAAPIALVVAADGLGKSTLIREHAASRGLRQVRFVVRPEHAAPGDFLRGLAEACTAANPAMARSSGPAIRQLEQGDGEAAAVVWAREHLAAVRGTVVLDDLHHASGEPRTASLICALIEATVPNVRWLLADRDGAWLPVPRWLSSGRCDLPLESGELRVTPDEIRAAFARAAMPLDAPAAHELYERSGGWPLGLAVALRTGHLAVAGSRDAVYDDIVDAAFAVADDDLRDRMYEVAAAGGCDDAITAALECDPSFGARLAAQQLGDADEDGRFAFLEPCRRRVLDRFERLPAARRDAILGRAAGALERAGRWGDAVALRIGVGDPDRIAESLERGGFRALDQGQVSAVRRALAALDERTSARRPTVLALKAALASLDESYDVSEAWFTMAIDRAAQHERREIVIRYGMDLVRRGRDDVVALLESEAAEAETRGSADADAALWALLGTAYVAAHRIADARVAARRAIVRLPAVEDDTVRARVLHQASYVALNDGDHALAKSLASRALARADASYLYDLAARALSVMFNVAMLHDDDVPAARSTLVRLEEAGRKAGNDGLRLYAILNAYAIEVDAGDVDALERLNRRLNEMQVLLTRMVSEGLLPAQALRSAWDGRFSHAYDLLAPGAQNLFDGHRAAYRWAECAVYGAAAGRHAEARAALARYAETTARLEGDEALAVRALAYVALAHTLLDDEAAALDAIARARAAAAPRGYGRIRTLVETVAAFYDCRARGADAVLALGDMLDELERCDLGGVARFIARLPTSSVDRRHRREEAV
jgi:LuxR family maltose regulon positive regulatory protein